MRRPSWFARTASALMRTFELRCPIRRGKSLLRRIAGRIFLVAELPGGLWVRLRYPNDDGCYAVWNGVVAEPRTVEVLAAVLAEGMVVVDVGANIGRYALMAAARVAPDGQVHAFEPTPAVFEQLRANAALNGLTNLVAVAAAVSDRTGSTVLHKYGPSSEMNSIVGALSDLCTAAPWQAAEVPTVTLDDYCRSAGLARIDVLKVDVEGAELQVLAGARALLTGPEAPLLFVEFFPAAMRLAGYDGPTLQRLIESYGYTCYGLENLSPGVWDTYNVLATRPEHWQRFGSLARFALTPWSAEQAFAPNDEPHGATPS